MGLIKRLIAVDNASEDKSVQVIASEIPEADIVRSAANTGVAAGFNTGLKLGWEPYVLLLTQDVVLGDRCISGLLRVMTGDATIGVAGCKLLYEDGITVQHSGGRILYPIAAPIQIGRWERDCGQYDILREVDYVTGAVALIRRRVFDVLGGFDEGFFPAYYEDTDFCFRAREMGFKVVYVPSAVAIHRERSVMGKFSYAHYLSHHRNRLRFVFKHLSLVQLVEDFLAEEVRSVETTRMCSNEAKALEEAYSQTYRLPSTCSCKESAIDSILTALQQLITTCGFNICDDVMTIRRLEQR